MDRGAWQATGHRVAESEMTEHTHKCTATHHHYHCANAGDGSDLKAAGKMSEGQDEGRWSQ